MKTIVSEYAHQGWHMSKFEFVKQSDAFESIHPLLLFGQLFVCRLLMAHQGFSIFSSSFPLMVSKVLPPDFHSKQQQQHESKFLSRKWMTTKKCKTFFSLVRVSLARRAWKMGREYLNRASESVKTICLAFIVIYSRSFNFCLFVAKRSKSLHFLSDFCPAPKNEGKAQF